MCQCATYVNTPDESKALDQLTKPKIIISASGMMTGGRVLHHIKVFAPDVELFVGPELFSFNLDQLKEFIIHEFTGTINSPVTISFELDDHLHNI